MENIKLGTTTLGLICKEGIVLAADRRMTTANYILSAKTTDKIFPITDNIAVTTAGNASDAQLIVKLVKAQLKLMEIRTGKQVTVKEAANLIAGIVYSNIRRMSMFPGISHFLLAGVDKSGFYLYDIYADGTLSKCNEYISSGSGSVMVYGVLETLYKPDMQLKDAIGLAVKSINAAMQRDTASGSGIDIALILPKGYKKYLSKEMETKITV